MNTVFDYPSVSAAANDQLLVRGPLSGRAEQILSPGALAFLLALHKNFEPRRQQLLQARKARQARLDAGEALDFPQETRAIRESEWTVAPLPADLRDRRVEITGPAERKMMINALNSGAKVFMADLEDSMTPSWPNLMDAQVNLFDAVRGTIRYEDLSSGKLYRLGPETAVLIMRPRGWHLDEAHLRYRQEALSGSLVDFGLYFYHNAEALLSKGSGPYFYLPKLEHYLEARLWNDVFNFAQDWLNIPRGSIRATVLIETLPAAFELDEILWELREHAAGLNCGRWDYIFSFIKKMRTNPACLLPDRAEVTMTTPFMRAYSRRVIQVCHRRGCSAIGGMAAQIPIRSDVAANEAAFAKVAADKMREATDGHDGTWVAHPGLVPLALRIFNEQMPTQNQISRKLDDLNVSASDLLRVPAGHITEDGIRLNIRVGIQYLEHWLRGQGCVALNHLMEDAATAEISRSQLWQWLRFGARYGAGQTRFTPDEYRRLREEELAHIRLEGGANANSLLMATELFDQLVLAPQLEDFLTIPAYRKITNIL
ncbi:MAG: malate synthase A [Saprospiraceae bacterium]|nr:malate synthase A [Saprospiraceae bacterium]